MKRKKLWKLLLFTICLMFLLPISANAKTVTVQKGTSKSVSDLSSGKWTSSNKKVATIKSGKIKAKKTGTVTLTSSNGKSISVIVYQNGSTLHTKKKGKIKLSGKCIYTEKKSIAKICSNPMKIKGKSKGTTYVYTTENNSVIRHKVTVGLPYFESEQMSIDTDSGTALTVKCAGSSIKWSYDDDVLYRENGKFYANEESGITTITATTNGTSCTCTAYIGNVIPYSIQVKTGNTKKLLNTKAQKLIDFGFSVEDTSVISVSDTGVVTGKKAGHTTISVKVMGKMYYCNVIVSNSANAVYVSSLSEYAPYIDADLYQAAIKYGLTYTVTDLLEGYEDNDNIAAYINISKHGIWTKNTEGAIAFHEMGHFFDYLMGEASQTAEFQKIYKEEKCDYFTEYARSTPREYFAEAYMSMIFDPYYLETIIPKTVAYIRKTEESITDADVQALLAKYPK